jgi:phosphatidylinositol alpha-1,6-mannosyltransferase
MATRSRTGGADRIRLLYVSHSLPPLDDPLENVGGLQRAAIELHDALAAHPEVDLLPLVLRSAWKERHYRVPMFMVRALATIAGAAGRREVDAVLFTSMVTAGLAVPLRRRLARRGVRTVAIANGLDVTLPVTPYQMLVRRALDTVDLVLPISRATGAECLARGLARERQVVVPLGVGLRRFPPPGDRAAARAELVAALGDSARPLPGNALLLCSVGRQVRRKGFAWFIEHVMPRTPLDVHYWLAGAGPEAARIATAIERHGVANRVRLLGRVPDDQLALLYRGSDLFVMPNVPVVGDMEGQGLVMLEAGACGLPSIASRLEGITDVITDGVNGHLVESGDAEAFVASIMRYHADRPALAAASGAARAHTVTTFGWDTRVSRYVDAIRSMTTER